MGAENRCTNINMVESCLFLMRKCKSCHSLVVIFVAMKFVPLFKWSRYLGKLDVHYVEWISDNTGACLLFSTKGSGEFMRHSVIRFFVYNCGHIGTGSSTSIPAQSMPE